MRKLLTLALLGLLFTSCSDDDNDNSGSLNGTTWVYEETIESDLVKKTVVFNPDTYIYNGIITFPSGENLYSSSEGTYRYDHPIVYFTEEGEVTSATISGNKMTVNNGSGIVYYKQK